MITARFDSSAIEQRLMRIAERGENIAAPLNAIGEVILTSIDKNFEQEGRYEDTLHGGSTKWLPLAQSTRLQRINGSRAFTKKGTLRKRAREKLSGLKILQRSGVLARSFGKKVYGNTCEVGSNRIYAAIHHYGGQAGRGRRVTIPSRPILVVQDEDVTESLTILDKHIGG